MREKTRRPANVPEFFMTDVRKIEPIGEDCIRIYCCIVRDGEWSDQGTILIPLSAVEKCSRRTTDAARELFMAPPLALVTN